MTSVDSSEGVNVQPGRLGAARFSVCSDHLADLVADAVFEFDADGRVGAYNRAFREAFCSAGAGGPEGALFCSVLECCYAGDGALGWGAPACAYCGWRRAVEKAAGGGGEACECRVLARSGRAYDLFLRTSSLGGRLLCAARDLYEIKRLRVLERAFFHDVLNHGIGIRGLAEMVDVSDAAQMAEYICLIQNSAGRMVDQMLWLRTLRGAEQGSLSPCVTEVVAHELLGEVVARCREDAESRRVVVEVDCEDGLCLETDRELARLVLGTLLQNAVEACRRGDRVCVSASPASEAAEFRILSPAALAEDVRAQLFQRSFSTKGPGRGVGVYGARLIVERILRGRLWFDNDAVAGAVFGAAVPLVWAGAPSET